jgi:hypothetical protein
MQLSAKRGLQMRTISPAGFDPATLKKLYGAFDTAWDSVKTSTPVADQAGVREAMGKTIFGLARHGYSNVDHLATFAAHRARVFVDLGC